VKKTNSATSLIGRSKRSIWSGHGILHNWSKLKH